MSGWRRRHICHHMFVQGGRRVPVLREAWRETHILSAFCDWPLPGTALRSTTVTAEPPRYAAAVTGLLSASRNGAQRD